MAVSVTLLGAVFIACYVFALVRPAVFPWVLAASLAFPHSAMAVVEETVGITPFHAGAVVAAAWVFLRHFVARQPLSVDPRAQVCLWVLVAYAGLITVLGPYLFQGVEVISPGLGIDAQVHRGTSLRYDLSNVAQYGYLVLGVAVAVYLAGTPARRLPALVFASALGVGLSTLRLVMGFLGLAWPAHLFDTMPDYSYAIYGSRLRGTFAEPSMLGGFAAVALVVFLLSFIGTGPSRRAVRAWLVLGMVAATACLVFSQSTTGYVAAVTMLGLVSTMLLRRAASRRHLLPYLVLGVIAAVAFIAWRGPALVMNVTGVLTEKLGTDSFVNRSASDVAGVRILAESWGLGVGLGSSRSSSLVTTLLSCIGVIGTGAFALVAILAVRGGLRHADSRTAAWGLVTLLAAQVVALPDLSNPLLWFLLGSSLAGGQMRAHDAAMPSSPPVDGVGPGTASGDAAEIGNAVGVRIRTGLGEARTAGSVPSVTQVASRRTHSSSLPLIKAGRG